MKSIIAVLSLILVANIAFAHGGGCRKDSPQYQCCHKNNSTGESHCH